MVQAYIIIQTDIGRAGTVAEIIRGFDGVVASDNVTGPYDVIVRAEVDTVDDLGRLVIGQIQEVDGITRNITCTVVRV